MGSPRNDENLLPIFRDMRYLGTGIKYVYTPLISRPWKRENYIDKKIEFI